MMKNINFVSQFKKANIISIVLFILSILLVFFKGLNYGIDFKGGTLIEVSTQNSNISELREILNPEFKEVSLQEFGDSKTTQFRANLGKVHKPAHGDGIFEVSRTMEGRMDFRVFEKWVNQLHERYGANLLRLKGIIHFEGQEAPSVIQVVQHILYPLETLSVQGSEEIGRLVLIGQEISRHELVVALEDLTRTAVA